MAGEAGLRDGPILSGEEVSRSSSERDVASGAPLMIGKFRVLGERASLEHERSFRALHLGTGRRVELRLLARGLGADGPEALRMLRAARAAGRAPHPNLLNVVDSGMDPEQRPFVVYEEFGGVPCTELVVRRGPLDLGLVANIVGQVLDGLSALHARGMVHRQLRAECVLVEGGADEVRVKLAGLGYSAQCERPLEAPELPRGYSRYLAPEARRGEGALTPAMDVYAAGVLMRYLLTGETSPDVPLPLQVARAIERATAEEPEERFQTAEQFRACVGAIAGPSPRESMIPSASLMSDLRFLLRRRAAAEDDACASMPPSASRLELFAVLLIVESVYARLGASGWRSLLAELPQIEELLPAAGKGAQYRSDGVGAELVARMLRIVDELAGKGNLRVVLELGEELARRGLDRFCAALPAQLTPECLVACVPVLWRSVVRGGAVLPLEQRDGRARLSVRGDHGAALELSVLFAGMLRGQLQALAPQGEVNLLASQALGDGTDIYVLRW